MQKNQSEEAFNRATASVILEWAEEEADLAVTATVNNQPLLQPREFYNTRCLEQILDKVVQKILGKDALINQIAYFKSTKKSKELTPQEWTDRIMEINRNMLWMSDQCYMMNKVTINQDIIKPNLPLE